MFMRRRQMLVFGAFLFFGSILFMIWQLDSSSYSENSYLEINDRNTELQSLESKVLQLESELESNRVVMGQVRKSMEALLKMGVVHDVKQRKELEELMKFPQVDEPVFVSSDFKISANMSMIDDTCQGLPYASGRANVDISDVYEKLPFDDVNGGVWKQGYPLETSDSEWVGKKLNVFVVPHSHNDPGWIKTLDKYFQDQTQHILNNVVDALSLDSKRRFIWAEISYLSMWWNIATEERKAKAKQLVRNGQLEIVTGGWVMNDEANTHYFAMIDQMIEGNEWLTRNIGVIPRSGWAIDPFGHSPTMAYLLKKMKFDNMLIQRVHYAVKKQLSLQKSLEFRWRQQWASDDKTDILCHMMPFYSYDVPHTCGPDPKICCQFDFARLPGIGNKLNCPWKVPPVAINDGNVAQRSAMLLDQYRKKSKLFKSNTLLVILGDDFRYGLTQEITSQYENYAKIFAYVNSHPELNAKLQFGTLSEYFDAMKSEMGGEEQLPALSGDFFTYADREDHYWSGYYTSRPFHKMQERVLETHLRGAEILFSLMLPEAKKTPGVWEGISSKLYPLLVQARTNLGLFQHHDGITGTSKDPVVVDYGTRLMRSVMDCKQIISISTQVLLLRDLSKFDPNFNLFGFDEVYQAQNQPPQPNIVKIPSENHLSATVVLYNSLAYVRSGTISLRINQHNVVVKSSKGVVIPFQINPVWSGDLTTSSDQYELLLFATVPATGLLAYTISCRDNDVSKKAYSRIFVHNAPSVKEGLLVQDPFQLSLSTSEEIVLENEHFTARFSPVNGFLQTITDKAYGVTTKVGITFVVYTSRMSKDKSGAYLFLPAGHAQPHIAPDHQLFFRVIRGPLMSEIHVLLPNLVHRVAVYRSDKRGTQSLGLHVCNSVDVRSGYDNKEIAMRLTSDIQSGKEFFTDLNGFQIQKRTTYMKLPLQANFYPMPTMAYIQDRKTRLSLLTAQPLGVSSLEEGQLEVIMDRRLMQDDNRGIGQGVKDNVLTPESFVILLEKWQEDAGVKPTAKLSYPSLASHHILWEMLNPIRVMNLQSSSSHLTPSIYSSFQPLNNRRWFCDLHLLNLRSIHSSDAPLPTDEAAMLLHRVGYECSLTSQKRFYASCTLPHSTVNYDVPVKSLFSSSHIRATSLSLQRDGAKIEANSVLHINPMEVESYRITLT